MPDLSMKPNDSDPAFAEEERSVHIVRRHPRELAPVQKTHARSMRSDMPKAEAVLWSRLRAKQLGGFKFRRQHPIGRYIADFACVSVRLVVELDGQSHEDRADYDAQRDGAIVAMGWRVLRYLNTDVLDSADQVCEDILQHCIATSGSSPASGGG